MQPSYKIHSLSASASVISFEQNIDENLNDYIVKLSEEIALKPFVGCRELIPAFASLTIYYDLVAIHKIKQLSPTKFVKSFLEKIIRNFEYENQISQKRKIVEIPVIYDGDDLEYVCNETGFSEKELIELHTAPLYRVYMMGFLPGFAYLGGMDRRLAVPRRASPRLKVPVGSVGIAGEQTGIYPLESPGGWQLIGRTEMPLFTPNENEITLLKQGDYVKFMAI